MAASSCGLSSSLLRFRLGADDGGLLGAAGEFERGVLDFFAVVVAAAPVIFTGGVNEICCF